MGPAEARVELQEPRGDGVVVLREGLAASLLARELRLEAVDAHAQRGDPGRRGARDGERRREQRAARGADEEESRCGAWGPAPPGSHATTVPEAPAGVLWTPARTCKRAQRVQAARTSTATLRQRAIVGGRSPIGRGRALKTPRVRVRVPPSPRNRGWTRTLHDGVTPRRATPAVRDLPVQRHVGTAPRPTACRPRPPQEVARRRAGSHPAARRGVRGPPADVGRPHPAGSRRTP